MKENIKLVVVGLLASLAVGSVVAAYSGSAKIIVENWYGSISDSVESSNEGLLGADSGTHFSQVSISDTLDVTSTATFSNAVSAGSLTVSGATTLNGTSTLGYTPNQLNTPQVAMNGNSTTVCAVQNTSGVRRIITDLVIASTGSTGDGAGTNFRAYVSGGRADNNTAATGTLFKTALLNIAATGVRAYGGPVPTSYFVSSTLAGGTAVVDIVTTTVAVWDNLAWVSVTSTAITSSTGNCIISSYPL